MHGFHSRSTYLIHTYKNIHLMVPNNISRKTKLTRGGPWSKEKKLVLVMWMGGWDGVHACIFESGLDYIREVLIQRWQVCLGALAKLNPLSSSGETHFAKNIGLNLPGGIICYHYYSRYAVSYEGYASWSYVSSSGRSDPTSGQNRPGFNTFPPFR